VFEFGVERGPDIGRGGVLADDDLHVPADQGAEFGQVRGVGFQPGADADDGHREALRRQDTTPTVTSRSATIIPLASHLSQRIRPLYQPHIPRYARVTSIDLRVISLAGNRFMPLTCFQMIRGVGVTPEGFRDVPPDAATGFPHAAEKIPDVVISRDDWR